jgi:hypothetical protein
MFIRNQGGLTTHHDSDDDVHSLSIDSEELFVRLDVHSLVVLDLLLHLYELGLYYVLQLEASMRICSLGERSSSFTYLVFTGPEALECHFRFLVSTFHDD